MQSIRRTDVPEYLRSGAWYNALDPDDDGAFDVPAGCFKPDPSVRSKLGLLFLLRSLEFWHVTQLPGDAVGFIYLYDLFDVAKEFPLHASDLQHLRTTKEATRNKIVFTTVNRKPNAANIRQQHQQTNCALFAEACAAAAGADDLESLTYLRENGCPWDANTIEEALQSGSIQCLEYAQAHGCPSLPTFESWVNLAAQKGHVGMIKHLRNSGEQWDENTMNCAASSGHLHCMQYLHNAGCPWGEHACLFAVMKGSLECLQYAHEHGCPWGTYITPIAACNGDLRCLQYAHEHGCEWNALVTCFAARSDRADILQYAHEHGCPWHEDTLYYVMISMSPRCQLYFHAANNVTYVVQCIVLGLGVCWFGLFAWLFYSLPRAFFELCLGNTSKLCEVVLLACLSCAMTGATVHGSHNKRKEGEELLLLQYLSPANRDKCYHLAPFVMLYGFLGCYALAIGRCLGFW